MPVALMEIPERRMPEDFAAEVTRVDEVRERLPLVGEREALAHILDRLEAESPEKSASRTSPVHNRPGII